MEIKHGHVYVDDELVGWATYIEEPFGHTLKALLRFLRPHMSQRWDSFEVRVRIHAGGTQYLQCSNIKRTGAATLDGKVWREYLISYEEEASEAKPSQSSPLDPDSAQ